MTKKLYIDIEADHYKPWKVSNIWCVVTNDRVHLVKDKLQAEIDEADEVIFHNGILYDIPVLELVWGIKVPLSKVFDTLLVSRLLNPDRDGGHSLKEWGLRVGFPKSEFNDFTKLSQEMIDYCKQDVRVTAHTHKALLKEMERLNIDLSKTLKLEHRFASLIEKQIRTGFNFDKDKASKLYVQLQQEFEKATYETQQKMPKKRWDSPTYKKYKQLGKIIKETDTYYSYIDTRGKEKKADIVLLTANPTSRQQFANYLITEYAWKPQEYTETGQPKISESVLEALPWDVAKVGATLYGTQKKISNLLKGTKGWINDIDTDGRIHGNVITNGANTGRTTSSSPNMQNVTTVRKDPRMRELFIPSEGWDLIDIDASGLEVRTLAHYIADYDGGDMAHEVIAGDIHKRNQEALGLNSRNSAKTYLYAFIYGAGAKKLGSIIADDRNEYIVDENKLMRLGSHSRTKLEDSLQGIGQLQEDLKKEYNKYGFLLGLDGRPLNPRSDYTLLSILNQSAGAIICKQFYLNVYKHLYLQNIKFGVDYNIVAFVHDEIVIESRPELSMAILEISKEAMKQCEKDFNLKVQLDSEGRIGKNWAEIH